MRSSGWLPILECPVRRPIRKLSKSGKRDKQSAVPHLLSHPEQLAAISKASAVLLNVEN
jgi:hypothetical protein